MAELYLLRHYPTEWNTARRIQGHTDIPLSENSLQLLQKITLPTQWLSFHWVASPMIRAQQTAKALGARKVDTNDALKEMNWGDFEGIALPEVEKEISALNLQPHSGLHFCPPGGESPADVCHRLQSWLGEAKSNLQSQIAVTHKGVIRAAICLATGWTMERPYSQKDHPALKDKIDWLLPIKFEISATGGLALQEINVRAW